MLISGSFHPPTTPARIREGRDKVPRHLRAFLRTGEPAYSALIQRVLAIPSKRHDRRLVYFLTRPEIEALLAAPDRTTWIGRRDYALLLLAVQTGLRLSELTGLDSDAVALGRGAHVRCFGKGRKERYTPLTEHTVNVMQAWLREPSRSSSQALFPNVNGGRLGSVYLFSHFRSSM